MASNRHVIAVRWHEGKYAVIADQIFNGQDDIDWRALEAKHPWNDVSVDTGYHDHASVVSLEQLSRYVRSDAARAYVERTKAAGVFLYLIHRAEYETGLG
ncbi:MAG TPA: hypothetical protein PLL83_13565 [Rhodoferax sp.]|nr:hypothetical protein [Rhodoferax sp.]